MIPKASKVIKEQMKKNESYVEYAIVDCEKKMALIIGSIRNQVLDKLTIGMTRADKNKFIDANSRDIHTAIDDIILQMMIKRK